jgi:tetratricopeptide (TPR) repeat protein
MSLAQFDKVLHDYVKAGKFKGYTVLTPANVVAGGYGSAVVSPAQAAAILADVHLHSPDYRDRAREEFEEVLKADPANALAWRGLGYASYMAKQFPEAARRFRRAEELDPSDPRVHFYSALLMQGEGVLADRSRLPEMIRELEAAVSLDPGFADAYGLLGYAQCLSGDFERGLAAMRKALSLDPHNEPLLYNLAMMYVNHRDYDTGIGLLEALEKSQNADMASRASRVLASTRKIRDSLIANAPFERRADAEPVEPEDAEDAAPPPSSPPPAPPVKSATPRDARRVEFIKGVLMAVDCSAPPSAVLTVTAGSATWKFTTADTHRLVVMGAGEFSCSWNKLNVALNYIQTGPGEGRIVSVEIQ